jgi:phospholipase D1/2
MEILDSLKSKFDKLDVRLGSAGDDGDAATEGKKHSHTHFSDKFHRQPPANRFQSFAPSRSQNDAKWYVDGCSYMWAVSVALEEATESIWILDWWLSPELYLRRPPSANPEYRLDKMLLAAAERGVKVNVIIYKEVSAVLTCEPTISITAYEPY